MKYVIRRVPSEPDYIELHVNQKLIWGSIVAIDPTDDVETAKEYLEADAIRVEGLTAFYVFVTELPGMLTEFIVGRYSILLSKAALFSWDDLLPNILGALEHMVAEDCKLEEAGELESKPEKKKKGKIVGKVPKQ